MFFSSFNLASLSSLGLLFLAVAVDARPVSQHHAAGFRSSASRNHGVRVDEGRISDSFASAHENFTSNRKRDFPATFRNPIKPGGGADPWVVYSKENDLYYLCQSAQGGIVITPSENLASFAEEGPVVWTPPDNMKELWAPELHWIDGTWYIYAAMDDGDNKNHKMFVLQGTSVDPTQPFNLVGQLNTPDDNWAIDGSVMQYSNGKLYFVWSGWDSPDTGFPQNLYIAEMCSPTQICSDRTLIHAPDPAWQKEGDSGVNEGPSLLEHNGRYFIIYSAAGSWGDNYSLAMIGIDGGADPLLKENWWAVDDHPVMWRNDEQGVYAPGHASFVTDRAGTPYVVYHAIDQPGAGWAGRTIRTEPFQWNPDGSPWFPRPNGFGVDIPQPQ